MMIFKRIPSYISSLKCCQWDKKPSKFWEKNQSISTRITAKITLWPGNSWKLFNRYMDLPAYNGNNLFIALWLVVITKYGEQLICSIIRDWLKKLWYIHTMEHYAIKRKKSEEKYIFIFIWIFLKKHRKNKWETNKNGDLEGMKGNRVKRVVGVCYIRV